MKISLKASLSNLWISVLFGVISWSVITPATVIILSRKEYSATEIGFFAALPFITILFTTAFLTKIIKKLGFKKSYYLAMLIITIPSFGFIMTDDFYVWCFLNFLSGFSGSVLWVVTESYIADIAPKRRKGKFIGLFETTIGAAYAIGPMLSVMFDLIAEQALILALVLRFISWGFFFFTRFKKDRFEKVKKKKDKLFKFVKAAQFLIVASFLSGFYETGTMGIITFYAIRINISEYYASIVPGIISFGSLLMQYPLGIMADKFNNRKILICCFILLLLSCIMLIISENHYMVFWVAIFIWGAAGGGLYTLAMVIIGKQYEGENILRATILLVVSYTLGSFLAPALGGFAMDVSNKNGINLLFFVITSLVFLVFLKSKKI